MNSNSQETTGAIDWHSHFYTSLPREYYFSDEIFEREHDKIFSRQWLYAGHISEVPSKGDYLTYEIGGESVVVVRGDGDDIHAHVNVCRHRGSRICKAGRGHTAQFVCPYHAWTYGLDGRLLNAPTIPDGEHVDYSDLGLVSVHVETWHGLIFICLGSETPEPIHLGFADIADDILHFSPERTKPAHELVHDVKANWKLITENNMECYHCPTAHDALCGVLDIREVNTELRDDDHFDSYRNFLGRGGEGLPVQKGLQTLSIDGKFVCKKFLGDRTEKHAGMSRGIRVLPIFAGANFYPDFWQSVRIRPLSKGLTRHHTQWFVHEDAEEGKDYNVADMSELFRRTNLEDIALVEATQLGVASRHYTPGPLSLSAEPQNHVVLEKYLEWMDAD